VSCRHHLYLDVKANGAIRLNFPDVAPDELQELTDTCALDVADRGGATVNQVATRMNLSRERARQLLVHAAAKLQATGDARELRGLPRDVAPPPKSRKRLRLPVIQDDRFDVDAFASEDLDEP